MTYLETTILSNEAKGGRGGGEGLGSLRSWLVVSGLHQSNSNAEHCMRNKKKMALHIEKLHKGMAHLVRTVHPKPLKYLKKMY